MDEEKPRGGGRAIHLETMNPVLQDGSTTRQVGGEFKNQFSLDSIH
jgi:hypothetical protein